MRIEFPTLSKVVWALLFTCVATPVAAAAATAEPAANRVITANVGQVKGPLNTMFKACVGAGRANEGLRADWQRQLTYAHEQCGFTYIRMHGLLDDDMGVYREVKGVPQYNWQYIDELYDFLERIHMKPFVELAFCPSDLASGTQTIFWYRGNVTQPKDPKKWADLIRALVTHWTQRYGKAEVRTWSFEVWNEPNLTGFWPASQQDYFHLYENTARAIKSVSPDYQVGGPATAGCAWIPQFMEFCTNDHVPLDFITSHTYGVDAGFLDEHGDKGTVLSHNPLSIVGDVLNVRKQIEDSVYSKLPLYITEWNTSYTPFDPVHDSYVSPAFICDKLKKCGDAASCMSYWTFTDIFEEAGPRFTPFHGGFGLMNYEDIRKPAFFAYQYLNRLGPTELRNSDSSSYVCTDASGGAQVLLWDFTVANPTDVNNQVFYLRDLPPKTKGSVSVQLTGLSPGSYVLSTYQVGYRVNDAFEAYKDLGSPDQLTREQVAHLSAESSGKPIAQINVEIDRDGKFERMLPMREDDVFLLDLKRK